MHDVLSMIYNLVCNNHIHGWIRTTSHDPIPKGSKRSKMTIFRVCEWKASGSWQVDVCTAYLSICLYTLWKSHRLSRNICFKWISTVCWALRSAASGNGKCTTQKTHVSAVIRNPGRSTKTSTTTMQDIQHVCLQDFQFGISIWIAFDSVFHCTSSTDG